MNFLGGLLASDRDPNSPQLAHVLSALFSLASVAWGTHYVIHTHTLPDAVTLGGLGAFSTVHYAVGRLAKSAG